MDTSRILQQIFIKGYLVSFLDQPNGHINVSARKMMAIQHEGKSEYRYQVDTRGAVGSSGDTLLLALQSILGAIKEDTEKWGEEHWRAYSEGVLRL